MKKLAWLLLLPVLFLGTGCGSCDKCESSCSECSGAAK